MDKIGLISSNLAEKIAMAVMESLYRTSAEMISETCGQSISAQGAWNMMQSLGERISEEEELEVTRMNGDGGSWIRDPYDPDVIFQLDRYHIHQEILRKIKDKKAQTDLRGCYRRKI